MYIAQPDPVDRPGHLGPKLRVRRAVLWCQCHRHRATRKHKRALNAHGSACKPRGLKLATHNNPGHVRHATPTKFILRDRGCDVTVGGGGP